MNDEQFEGLMGRLNGIWWTIAVGFSALLLLG